MNCLPRQTNTAPASGSNPVVVSLLATESTNFVATSEAKPPCGPTVEEEIKRRADAMTAVLAKIMDRPDSIRHWGLNE